MPTKPRGPEWDNFYRPWKVRCKYCTWEHLGRPAKMQKHLDNRWVTKNPELQSVGGSSSSSSSSLFFSPKSESPSLAEPPLKKKKKERACFAFNGAPAFFKQPANQCCAQACTRSNCNFHTVPCSGNPRLLSNVTVKGKCRANALGEEMPSILQCYLPVLPLLGIAQEGYMRTGFVDLPDGVASQVVRPLAMNYSELSTWPIETDAAIAAGSCANNTPSVTPPRHGPKHLTNPTTEARGNGS